MLTLVIGRNNANKYSMCIEKIWCKQSHPKKCVWNSIELDLFWFNLDFRLTGLRMRSVTNWYTLHSQTALSNWVTTSCVNVVTQFPAVTALTGAAVLVTASCLDLQSTKLLFNQHQKPLSHCKTTGSQKRTLITFCCGVLGKGELHGSTTVRCRGVLLKHRQSFHLSKYTFRKVCNASVMNATACDNLTGNRKHYTGKSSNCVLLSQWAKKACPVSRICSESVESCWSFYRYYFAVGRSKHMKQVTF
jgi:hypothetical protein